jgi:hypothetical protein
LDETHEQPAAHSRRVSTDRAGLQLTFSLQFNSKLKL